MNAKRIFDISFLFLAFIFFAFMATIASELDTNTFVRAFVRSSLLCSSVYIGARAFAEFVKLIKKTK